MRSRRASVISSQGWAAAPGGQAAGAVRAEWAVLWPLSLPKVF
jgi:hypothetical protein